MEHICYFCSEKLSSEDSRYYDNFYIYFCKNCPDIYEYRADSNVWKKPYSIIIDDENIIKEYMYFETMRIWLCQIFNENRLNITNHDGYVILALDTTINTFSLKPDQLKNKIKNWILFS